MDGSTNYVISESPWSLTEHGRKAELKLKSNVYDLEAWSVLIREAQVRILHVVVNRASAYSLAAATAAFWCMMKVYSGQLCTMCGSFQLMHTSEIICNRLIRVPHVASQ